MSGTWKTMVRLHSGRELVAAPVYLPPDPVIHARGVAAETATRQFVSDRTLLQREYAGGPVWLVLLAYVVLGVIVATWFGALAWGLRRLTFPYRHASAN